MSLFGGSTNSGTNKSNQDDKPKESAGTGGGMSQKEFAAMFAKKEEPTAANGEEAKKPEGTEKPNIFGGLFSAPPKSPAKEEKKDESPTKPGGGLFGNLASNTGTFTVPSTLGSGLLGGNVAAAPTLAGGLFGNAGAPTNTGTAAITGTALPNTDPTASAVATGTTATTGTTASPQRGGGGLFGGIRAGSGLSGGVPATGGGFGGSFLGGGLFGGVGTANTTATTGTTGGGLFGNKPAGQTGGAGGGGLFGGGGAATPTATTGTTGGGLFGGGGSGALFASGAITGGGGLFGNNSPPKAGAGGLNIGSLQGNVQYVPNLNAPTTGKTGTVNYDLKFGKSNENYEIYSITCASNADKNKSIEELRAEDYELIRTGELPEALQLKIIDNRERLEKNLGFVLPVPTPSNKSYTKIFKSTTRNTSMKSTFMNNKYADVKFKVEMEEIPAHRNVLGLCSPFFDDLFSKHQSDTFPLVIDIPDVKAETFKAILEFLYTGEVNLYEDLAVDLILHGQKFDVMDLVQAADDFISKMINIDNYMKVLEISDRLSSKPLRKKVFTFIVRNMKMISKREDFEELPRDFLMEILENAIAA